MSYPHGAHDSLELYAFSPASGPKQSMLCDPTLLYMATQTYVATMRASTACEAGPASLHRAMPAADRYALRRLQPRSPTHSATRSVIVFANCTLGTWGSAVCAHGCSPGPLLGSNETPETPDQTLRRKALKCQVSFDVNLVTKTQQQESQCCGGDSLKPSRRRNTHCSR